MTFDTEKIKSGRMPLTIVELDLDVCTLTYGSAPCTAAGAVGSECYNTRKTCQDAANYTKGTKTYRFCEPVENLPTGINMMPVLVKEKRTGTKIEPGEGLGKRGIATLKFKDFPSHDRDIDPYVATRTYDPAAQGTFWGKLIARNPYYQGRILRIRTAYITEPWDWANTEDRVYMLESITGPDRRGNIKLIAKDLLKLADDKRAQCPPATKGELTATLTTGETGSFTITSGEGADYPAADGEISINDEIIGYATRAGDTFSTLTRAQWGTVADEHDEGDRVQLCKSWTSVNVVDIIEELLTTYAGIDGAYIPTTDWADEKALWLASHNFTTIIIEPEGVNKLLGELMQQAMLYIWWDEIAQLVKLRTLAPSQLNALPDTINDDEHILADSVSVKEYPKGRYSQVWVFYAIKDYTDGLNVKNFTKVDIQADAGAESADQYGDQRILKVYSRWMNAANAGQAAALAGRLFARVRDNPIVVKFALDAKDSSYWTGDAININTDSLQDVSGANAVSLINILSATEKETGTRFEYEAMVEFFSGFYGFIMANTAPVFSAATDEEKRAGGYIAPNSGVFSDGTDAYKII